MIFNTYKYAIFNEKLYFRENANSKVNSFENIEHQARLSDKQIYTEHLPWLRFNKPNLPEHVKEQINRKQYSIENNTPPFQNIVKDHAETPEGNKKQTFAKVHDNKDGNKENSSKLGKENNEIKKEIKYKNSDGYPKIMQPTEKAFQKIDKNKKSLIYQQPYRKENDLKHIDNKETYTMTDDVLLQVKKSDVSTETEKGNFVSVEIQTMEEKISKQTNKLKKSLEISNTFENNYSTILKRDKNQRRLKLDQPLKEHKEEIITSRIIETFLPSICYNDKDDKTKLNKLNSCKKNRKSLNFNPLELSSTKNLITHAGMDFLDQYWATQRWLKLNKHSTMNPGASSDFSSSENFPECKTEIPFVVNMKGQKQFEQKEKLTFRDLFNERVQYYTDPLDTNQLNSSCDKITSIDLENIIL